MKDKSLNILNYIFLPLLIILLWNYTTNNDIVSKTLLPSIEMVLNCFKTQLQSGQLIKDLSISISRVLKGFTIASIVGITLGVFMGVSGRTYKFFILTLSAIRQIPIMAWIPLIVLWFGIGEQSKVVIIIVASFFPILINTINGIVLTDSKLIEVGRMYKLSKWKKFTKIYFPSALPNIIVGLKLGLGVSWMAVVGAEMIAASSGIGYRINDARSLMQSDIVFVGMISIAIVGLIMDRILTTLSSFLIKVKNERY